MDSVLIVFLLRRTVVSLVSSDVDLGVPCVSAVFSRVAVQI